MIFEFKEKHIKQVNNFINDSIDDHQFNGRNRNMVASHIMRGKLAEIAFYEIIKLKILTNENSIKNISEVNFVNRKYGDGEYDFIVTTGDNKVYKVDVKSIKESDRRLYKIKEFGADIIAVMRYYENNSNPYCEYIGSLKSEDIYLNYDPKNFANFAPVIQFTRGKIF